MNKIDSSDNAVLVNELETNPWKYWSNFGSGANCALHDEEDALWFKTPIPILPYNGILRLQAENKINQYISEFVNHFKVRQVAFLWLIHPTSAPHDLPSRLANFGLQEIKILPGMKRNLENLPEYPQLPDDI